MNPVMVERLNVFGELLHRDLGELTEVMRDEMAYSIDHIPSDPVMLDLITTSVRSNLETIVQVLLHVVDVEDVATPVGASEYARRLAQNGVPSNALLRAYRVGQRMFDEWAYALVLEREADPARALGTYHALAQIAHRYIDTISERVFAEYQDERDRWLSERSTVRAEVIERLIAGEHIAPEVAEAGLGHRLRQWHLGLVFWSTDPSAHGADLAALEHVAVRLGKSAGMEGMPLFWPKDRNTGWVWMPVGHSARVPDAEEWERAMAGVDGQFKVAMGRPAAGPEGFRVTHLEALLARQVALVAGDRAPRMTSYGDPDVRAVSLLASDLERARRLVATALGGLASDNEQAERLRQTVQVFLDEKGSYLATAERLHLHKNTVKYRVDKAMEGRGRPVTEDRFDLELALMACDWLGPAVLDTRSD